MIIFFMCHTHTQPQVVPRANTIHEEPTHSSAAPLGSSPNHSAPSPVPIPRQKPASQVATSAPSRPEPPKRPKQAPTRPPPPRHN